MKPLPNFPVGGGCQCGAVRYQLLAPPLGVYACHCADCRRFSGTTHTLSMPIRKETLRHLAGALSFFDKTAGSGRVVRMVACANCGNKLWNEPLSAPELIILKPGTLDDMSWAEPVGHIWTASRVSWVEIDAGQPGFAGQPPSREALYAAWDAAHEGHGDGR